MRYRLDLKGAFYALLIMCAPFVVANSESLQLKGRLSLKNDENDLAVKLYLLPHAIYPKKFSEDKSILWLEKGRSTLKHKLYREYLGAGIRFFPRQYWGVGGYGYIDGIGKGDGSSEDTSEERYLSPKGMLCNIGIEGFSSYLNANINFYGQFLPNQLVPEAFTFTQLYTFYFPKPVRSDGFGSYAHRFNNQKAIDINFWRRFSNAFVHVGGFYRWCTLYPDSATYCIKKTKLSSNNWGGCITLEYFLTSLAKVAVKGSWDNWNRYQASFGVTFESHVKALPIYQPTRRYLLPVQYDSKAESFRLAQKDIPKKQATWGGQGPSWNWGDV